VILQLQGLSKAFGSVVVADAVDLDVEEGAALGIIGPNGAGKTSLFNLVTGTLEPDAGVVRLAGRDITALPPQARARAGIARSFQITSIFPSFSAEANVALAVQGRRRHSFRFWRPADRDPGLSEPAQRLLAEVGLGGRGRVPARTLSHGEHRLLELAIALAQRPKLLLLDEPMAGLGSEESKSLVEFLRTLKGRYTIILVEHDMDAVFALADRISVLNAGRIIATGLPDAIRVDPQVRIAYLGDEMPGGSG
jgi:branched-chain amino acid transport system ATP-binding protein